MSDPRKNLTPREQLELAMRWHDRELAPEEQAHAEELVAEGGAQHARALDWALIGELVREADAERTHDFDVSASVMERVAQSALPAAPRAVVRSLPRRAWLGAAGVLAAAAAIALLMGGGSDKPIQADLRVAAPAAAMSAPEPDPPGESVAIEAVDFGTAPGAIFLVPGTDDRTVVIWTIDDSVDVVDADQEVDL